MRRSYRTTATLYNRIRGRVPRSAAAGRPRRNRVSLATADRVRGVNSTKHDRKSEAIRGRAAGHQASHCQSVDLCHAQRSPPLAWQSTCFIITVLKSILGVGSKQKE